MKYILLFLFSGTCYAGGNFTFDYNFLTHHFSKNGASRYENKVSGDGRTINNPIYGLTFASDDRHGWSSFTLFSGKDSIDSELNGFVYSSGFGKAKGTTLQLGWYLGSYLYDQDAWDNHYPNNEIITPSWVDYYFGLGGINVLAGITLNLQIEISPGIIIRFNNYINPALTNHTFSFGFTY
jgi:hypothetical protein